MSEITSGQNPSNITASVDVPVTVDSGATVAGVDVTAGGVTYTGTLIDGDVFYLGNSNYQVELTINSGAEVSGITVEPGGYADNSGQVTGVTVGAAGEFDTEDGTEVTGVVLSGGEEDVNGGVDIGAILNAGSIQSVEEGFEAGQSHTLVAVARNATVNAGAIQYVGGAITGLAGDTTLSSPGVATSTDVKSGGIVIADIDGTLNNPTIEAGGELVYGGGDVTNAIFYSGATLYVGSSLPLNFGILGAPGAYYAAAGVIVPLGGDVITSLDEQNETATIVGSPVTLNAANVQSGVTLIVDAGGTVSGGQVLSGGTLLAISGGIETGVQVAAGGTALVSAGGTAVNLSVASGAVAQVLSGGVLQAVQLASGAQAQVASGGLITSIVLHSGNRLTVSAGSTASNISVGMIVSGDDPVFAAVDGTSDNEALNDATVARLVVNNGGLLLGATIIQGGNADIYGSATDLIVSGAGAAYVHDGGTIIDADDLGELYLVGGQSTNAIISAGGLFVVASDSVDPIDGEDGLPDNPNINQAGLATGTDILSGGLQYVGGPSTSGQVTGTAVETGGVQILGSNGLAQDELVESGGTVVLAGGTLSTQDSTLAGATIVVGNTYTTPTAIDLAPDGSALYQAGAILQLANNDVVVSGFQVDDDVTQVVRHGGIADQTLIGSGGLQVVLNIASDTFVLSRGIELVTSAGTATATNVLDDASLFIMSLGVADDAIITSDGGVIVTDFGSLQDAQILSGAIVEAGEDGLISGGLLADGGVANVLSGGSVAGLVVGGVSAAADSNDDGEGGVITPEDDEGQGESNGSAITGEEGADPAQLTIYAGGLAEGVSVTSGGLVAINGGSFASGTVMSNSLLYVWSGGDVSENRISGGEVLFGGESESDIIGAGGVQQITSDHSAALLYGDAEAESSGANDAPAYLANDGYANNTLPDGDDDNAIASYGSPDTDDAIGIEAKEDGTSVIAEDDGETNDFGLASNTIVKENGTQVVGGLLRTGEAALAGQGGAQNTFVDSHGIQIVLSGGLADGTFISDGGIILLAGGSATDLTVDSGGIIEIAASITPLVNFGDDINGGEFLADQPISLSSDGSVVVSDIDVTDGALGIVESGGTSVDENVFSGGNLQILSGGLAIDAMVVNGGLLIAQEGGVVSGVILSGGEMQVESGGTAYNIGALSGADLFADDAGNVQGVVISAGGILTVSGGVVSGGTADAQAQIIISAGLIDGSQILSGATLTVLSGGTAQNDVIGGLEKDQGISDQDIISGGTMIVGANGMANDTIVSAGMLIASGGTVSSADIMSGATALDATNGVLTNPVIEAGGTAIVDGGSITGIVSNNGLLSIAAGNVTIDGMTGNGDVVVADGASLTLGGTDSVFDLQVLQGGALNLNGATVLTDPIEIAAGSTIGGSGIITGDLTNNGTISAGGALELTGNITGTGAIVIANGATLEVDGNVGAGVTIAFAGSSGTLAVASGAVIQGAVMTQPGNQQITVTSGAYAAIATSAVVIAPVSSGGVSNSSSNSGTPSSAVSPVASMPVASTPVGSATNPGFSAIVNGATVSVAGGSGQIGVLGEGQVVAVSGGTLIGDATGQASDIARLYDTAFGRTADVAGLQYWLGQEQGGKSLTMIASYFAASPEFIMNYGGLNNTQFLTQLYQNTLNRVPDATGLAYWQQALTSGVSRGTVLMNFAESQENKANTIGVAGARDNAQVSQLYQTVFNRMPDAGGLAYWASFYDAGQNTTQIAAQMMATSEYQADMGGLSNNQFMTDVYANALQRAPDSSGLNYWTQQLNLGVSRATVLAAFADSAQTQAYTSTQTHAGYVFIGS